jgi:nucleoside-diphosphate-sugar epimerase
VTDRRLRGAAILVTGGTGLIGRHLLRALAHSGVDTFAVVRPRRESLVRHVARPIVWDLAEENSRSRLPARLDGVVHLAAPRNRWSARGAPLASHIRISVDAAARVFDAARARGASRAIYVSSIAVAGPRDARSGRGPAAAPTHPYAMTKRWGEELAIALRAQVRRVTIVRPGPVYGPGQSPFGLLARFAARLKRREPIEIAAPHGRLVSPVFVGDVVDVIVASLAQPANVTMSVGGPRAYRERALVEDLAGWLALPCRIRADRSERPSRFDIDNSDVDRLFPRRQRTSWADGLRLTWRRRPSAAQI